MIFSKAYEVESDESLLSAALAGDRKALEVLVSKHQHFLYNVSLRLFLNPEDALDATQEVWIKVLNKLQSFQRKSQFRTWLYRIAVNHFLNAPKKKMELLLEYPAEGLSGFTEDEVQDETVVEEVRLICSTAMLMCLTREQRLLYIIGEIFGADHQLGAALFELSPANYRVKLHRAKADLLQFVAGRCGLVDPQNPCRCPKKAKVMVQQGWVNPENLLFNAHFSAQVKDLVEERRYQVSDEIQLRMKELFRESPFQIHQELDQLLLELTQKLD